MIKKNDLVRIGKFAKPHGVKGELSFHFTDDSFDDSEHPFLICELDGIFIPFRLEEYRFRSDTSALVMLKGINSEVKARELTNKEVYFLKNHLKGIDESRRFTWEQFVGYSLVDHSTGVLGEITEVDDSTLNVLFVLEQEGKDALLIPASEEIITHIDPEEKQIYLTVPEGLLDL